MIVTKEFLTRLMSLKVSGKKTQYTQASTVLVELQSGQPVSKNFRQDTRIPNCLKYELPEGYRLVFQSVEGVEGQYLALFVGTHDDTDHFLDTHKGWIFDPTKHTLKELRWNTASEEVLNSVRSPELKAATPAAPNQELAFARLSDEQLVNAGLTPEQLIQARQLADPDSMEMMAFLEQVADNTSSVLLAYTTGSVSEREEIEALLLKQRDLVPSLTDVQLPALNACSDTFINLADIPEEKRAFEELPFEDWMLYLHPDQRTLVHKKFNGPARLRGVSGSGKTVVAIHRARAVAQQLLQDGSQERVLFLTFNRSLRDLVERLLRRLCTDKEYERIEVATIGKWALQYIKFRTGAMLAWSDQQVDRAWMRTLGAFLPRLHQVNLCLNISSPSSLSSKDGDVQFVTEETDFIYGKFLHKDSRFYLTTDRLGRGRRIGANQRALFLDIYSAFVEEIARIKQYDARELARIACALVESRESPRESYAAIVVDEVQDLTDIELRIVKTLGELAGSLFLVGDGAQQIYRRGQSLKSIGINVAGRSFVLRKNYRNTSEIIKAATELRSAQGIGRFDEEPTTSQIDAIPSAVSGDMPVVMVCPNLQRELDLVVKEILYLTNKLKFLPSQICCMSRVPHIRERVLESLAASGIKAVHYRADGVGSGNAVLVSTLHNAKGHEFRAVFILGLYEGALPLYSATDDEGMEGEAALLYVAMTRAKELLYLSYSTTDSNGKLQQRSRFLNDMRSGVETLDFTAERVSA
jgi:superfamily I DNA/RNA helicase